MEVSWSAALRTVMECAQLSLLSWSVCPFPDCRGVCAAVPTVMECVVFSQLAQLEVSGYVSRLDKQTKNLSLPKQVLAR